VKQFQPSYYKYTERAYRVKDRLFFLRGYLQGFFVTLLLVYVWFFPERSLHGSRLDTIGDITGIGCLVLGGLLRIWAVSYPGKHTRSRRIKAPLLITTGPYAFVRNPIYLGNFLIGLGLVVTAEAMLWIPFYFFVFGLPYRRIVAQEEKFLKEKFGDEFDRYCNKVQRWVPQVQYNRSVLKFGANFHIKELGTTFGILFGAYFFEWIESPLHRAWLSTAYRWLAYLYS